MSPPHQPDPSTSASTPELRTKEIEVQNVTKTFNGRTVLDSIKLDVYRGETLCILGGSGSGKSTLLRLMIGNVKPDGGDIIGLGKSLANMTVKELNEYRKCIGVLFQSGALYNSMTIGENVALPLQEHTDLADETIAIIVKIKLEQVGLRE
jgi:phospholipid/cholesterol/gamma-HCH transport system ATP-binding protein